MASKKTETGDRLKEIKNRISLAARTVDQAKAERREANEVIGAERAALETLGIPRKAFDMAKRYVDLDPDERRGFDLAYAICREALGEPLDAQGDLIDMLDAKDKAENGSGADEARPTA